MAGALPTYTKQIQGRWAHVQGIQSVWFGGGEKRGLYLVSSCGFFWKYTLLG